MDRRVVWDCKLRNRLAEVMGGFDAASLAREGPQALIARWLPDVVLDVREWDTGRPVDHVILWEATSLAGSFDSPQSSPHPGLEAERDARDVGPSPVRIPPVDGPLPRALYARGPGLAWGRIEVWLTRGEPNLVRLDPGGDLDLDVHGAPRDPSTLLKLVRSEGPRETGAARTAGHRMSELIFHAPLGDATSLRIGGLPLGRYTAQAEIRPDAPVLVGSCEFEVRADALVTAALQLEPPPTARLVPLEGELVLPTEWELASFAIRFERLGTRQTYGLDGASLEREAGTRDRYRWALPPVPPGRYTATIEGVHSCALDTGTTGRLDALIDVPSPCAVSLRCVDVETGADAAPESLTWTATGHAATRIARVQPGRSRTA